MTFTEWIYKMVDHDIHGERPEGWRMGQFWFNSLSLDGRSDLASAIQGSDVDPFYDDSRMDVFLEDVARRWGT